MTATAHAPFRTVSFAAPNGGVWGAAIEGGLRCVAFGAPAGTLSAIGPESIDWIEEEDQWQLAGEGFELLISPAAAGCSADGTAVHQLCHVRGHVSLDGAEQTVDCPGGRSTTDRALEIQRVDSVRSVSAWFEGEQGLTLLAVRPHGAPGHERDLLSAAVFEGGSCIPVSDPRLSTTYASDGLPARASLELWLGESETQQLRRAAGEALGPFASALADGLQLRAQPFRWPSKAPEGHGVYLLVRIG